MTAAAILALQEAIAEKKAQLDSLRPLSAEALLNLEHYYDLEITYASNAIEGNTLSPVETTLVIEKGITITGKPLKDHLEALDHYDAMRYVRELGRETSAMTESDVRNLHRLVMQRSRPDIAGQYANLARYVRTETGRHEFPAPAEIPALMGDYSRRLQHAPSTTETGFDAHRRLVDHSSIQRWKRQGRPPRDELNPDSWGLSSDRCSSRRQTGLYRRAARIAGWSRNGCIQHSSLSAARRDVF